MTQTARSSAARPKRAPRAPAREPHLRVVRSKRSAVRPRLRRGTTVGLLAIVAVALVVGIQVVHVRLAQATFTLEDAQTEQQDLRSRFESLRLEVAELEGPERIDDVAMRKLGMVHPEAEDVTYLSDGEASSGTDGDNSLDSLTVGGRIVEDVAAGGPPEENQDTDDRATAYETP